MGGMVAGIYRGFTSLEDRAVKLFGTLVAMGGFLLAEQSMMALYADVLGLLRGEVFDWFTTWDLYGMGVGSFLVGAAVLLGGLLLKTALGDI